MPVSPQDFALWSDLTGNPYPQTPAERMALAPTVYEFNKNIGRRGGPTMGPMRRTADVLGKAALAAGALAGVAYLGGKYFGGEQETPDTGISFGKLNLDDEVDVPPTGPAPGGPPTAPANLNYGDITPPTTAKNFNQELTPNQTSVAQAIRGTSPYKPTVTPIEEKPANQSEVISTRQHFSPGSEVEMLSEDAAQKAAAFRASKAYSVMQQQYPGLREIQSPTQAEPAPTFTDVAPSPQMRIATEVSPVTAMVQSTAQGVVPTDFGASIQETRELDTLLARTLANKSQEERIGIRNQMLSQKYGATPAATEPPAASQVKKPLSEQFREKLQGLGSSLATHTRALDQHFENQAGFLAQRNQALEEAAAQEAQPIITAPTGPVRVAREGRITPNEFLSVMSQQEGPLASYSIDSSRSKAVSGLAFYPGGEIEVTQRTKGGPVDYAYATSDPYRLALSDYAEEGFPAGMGSIGGVVAARNLGHQMGLQKSVESGGTIRQKRQPLYAGLMSDADIMAAGMDKSRTAKAKQTAEQAERHFETKNVMEGIESKYPQSAMSPEEKSKLREERKIRSLAPPVNRTGGFAGSPEATDFLRAAKQALISR